MFRLEVTFQRREVNLNTYSGVLLLVTRDDQGNEDSGILN